MKNPNESQRLFRAVSHIGSDLIDEAEATEATVKAEKAVKTDGDGNSIRPRSRRTLRRVLIAAALFLLVFAAAFAVIWKKAPEPEKPFLIEPTDYDPERIADLPEALRHLSVTSDGGTSHSVATDGCFYVETAAYCEVETLTQYLAILPTIPFSVSRLSDTTFKLAPADGDLAGGTLYRITVGDPENPAASYAFQTESELCVKSILPADDALYVPTDAGIEFILSEPVDRKEVERCFSVSPSVSGSIVEYNGSCGCTFAFAPSKGLREDTVYTVTIRDGMKAKSGKTLAEDRSVRFRTTKDGYSPDAGLNSYFNVQWSSMSSLGTVFSPGEDALCGDVYIDRSRDIVLSSLVFSLYRYPSAEDACQAILTHEKNAGEQLYGDPGYPTKDLIHVGEYPIEIDTNRYDYSVSFGRELDAGVYLAKGTVTAKNGSKTLSKNVYGFFQVTNLRAYTVAADDTVTYFLNRINEGKVSGATVESRLYSKTEGWNIESDIVTDKGITENGLYALKKADQNTVLSLFRQGEDAVIGSYCIATREKQPYYLNYLYTDRETYAMTDEVRLWGILRPAGGTDTLPDKVMLRTGYSGSDIDSITVPVNKDGCFRTSFSFEDLGRYGFYVTVTDTGGHAIGNKFIRVTEEQKPTLKADFSYDKLYYRPGDPINVTVSLSFYDDTPAVGFEIQVTGNYFAAQTAVTDKNGKATVTYTGNTVTSGSGTFPITLTFQCRISGTESENGILGNDYLYYYPSDIHFRTQETENGWQLLLNRWDHSETERTKDPHLTAAIGAPVDGEITVLLKKTSYTEQTSSSYDSYYKRVVTYTRHIPYDSVVDRKTVRTSDGQYLLSPLPERIKEAYADNYYYAVTYTVSTQYLYSGFGTQYSSDSTAVIEKNQTAYRIGDTLSAECFFDGEKMSDALFLLYADRMLDIRVCDTYTAVYDRSMDPSAVLCAIVFDKTSGAYRVCRTTVDYDWENNNTMPVSVNTDKDSYLPGETATVTVRSGGAGGTVLLSIADEACFALGEQTVTFAEDFYQSGKTMQASFNQSGSVLFNGLSPYGYYGGITGRDLDGSEAALYAEELEEAPDVAMEKADAGNAASSLGIDTSKYRIREDFRDNAMFLTAELDENGEATVLFPVPDNLTTWRITALAVSGGDSPDEMLLGNAASDTAVTQSFFVRLSVNDTYIVGDDIAFSLRSFGKDAEGSIRYVCELRNGDGELLSTVAKTAMPSEYAYLNFGKSDEGSYDITVYAEDDNGHRDALKNSFTVVKSASLARVQKEVTPDEIAALSPQRYPMTLFVRQNDSSYAQMQDLICHLGYGYESHSDRTDDLIAVYYALLLDSERNSSKMTEEKLSALQSILETRKADGQFRLLPWGETDILLTARILAISNDLFTVSERSNLAALCYDRLSSSAQADEKTLCSMLWILASLGEPVLDRLYAILDVAGDYPTEAKLILAAAFAGAGDYSAADAIYRLIRADIGAEDKEYGTLYFKDAGQTRSFRLTTLALFTASRICRTDAQMLVKFLTENRSAEESASLSLACYLRYYLSTDAGTSLAFSYHIGNEETRTVTIAPNRPFTLSLTKREKDALCIDRMDEGLGILASYEGSMEESVAEKTAADRLSIAKTIQKDRSETYTVTLHIEGSSTRVYENFSIGDVIPSGARFVSTGYTQTTYSSKKESGIRTNISISPGSGQNMIGYLSIVNEGQLPKESKDQRSSAFITCPAYHFSAEISYQIRAAQIGEFVAERATVQNIATAAYAQSDRYTVTITESGKWGIKSGT